MYLRLLDMTAFATLLSEVPLCWEYCFTQKYNQNRFKRLKFEKLENTQTKEVNLHHPKKIVLFASMKAL